ncbi:unnamed protein product, partial [Laminaria digitata]
ARLLAPSLKYAACAGEADLLATILALGASANTRYSDEYTYHALHLAACNGNLQSIRALLQSGAPGADPRHRRSEDDRTALELAVNGRSIAVVKTILQHGVAPQDVGAWNYTTALHTAAAGDEVEAIRVIVEAGEDVDVRDGQRRTPLHIAAAENNPEAVRVLCELGADHKKWNMEGMVPLHLGVSLPSGSPQAVAELLKAGADPAFRIRNSKDHSSLDMAAILGDVGILRALLDYGADATAVDGYQVTALHRAACRNKVGAIHVLIEAGADVDSKDADERTPLNNACECLQIDAADALFGYGASINAPNDIGETPLHRATQVSHEDRSAEIVDFLLRRGADETAADAAGNIPRDVLGIDARRAHRLSHPPFPSPRVVSLLDNAPRDRAWGRRSFLVIRARKMARVEGRGGDVAGNNNGGGGEIAHGGAAGGASVAGDVVAAVVGLQDDAVFRNVVGFL